MDTVDFVGELASLVDSEYTEISIGAFAEVLGTFPVLPCIRSK